MSLMSVDLYFIRLKTENTDKSEYYKPNLTSQVYWLQLRRTRTNNANYEDR
jgi:hypothetical protein